MTNLLFTLALLGGALDYSLPPPDPGRQRVTPRAERQSASEPARRTIDTARPDLEMYTSPVCEPILARKISRYAQLRVGPACPSSTPHQQGNRS